eukprot:COSAG03_NODE_611_length_6719_cov_11.319335_3_plen_193_part_00
MVLRHDALLEAHADDPRTVALLDQRIVPLVLEHGEVEADRVGASVFPLQVHHTLGIANELQQPSPFVRAEEELRAALALGLVHHAGLYLHERFLRSTAPLRETAASKPSCNPHINQTRVNECVSLLKAFCAQGWRACAVCSGREPARLASLRRRADRPAPEDELARAIAMSIAEAEEEDSDQAQDGADSNQP